MNKHILLYAALCEGVLKIILLSCWYSFWKRHARKFVQSGYTPPAPSFLGKIAFTLGARVITFLSVGPVKVIAARNSPRRGRAIFVSNHEFPSDFAMLHRGAGRHFRMLTAASELKGFFGVVSAWVGVISVNTKQENGGQAAEVSCVNAVAKPDGALGIFPPGALRPEDLSLSELWRPGAVRIARSAAEAAAQPLQPSGCLSGMRNVSSSSLPAPVQIVPMALYYKRSPEQAHWSHRFLARTRSSFYGMRNPRSNNPIFSIDLNRLDEAEKARVLAERKSALAAYAKSKVSIYGGVVAVGEPIMESDLPADQIEAIAFIRDRVKDLLVEARKH